MWFYFFDPMFSIYRVAEKYFTSPCNLFLCWGISMWFFRWFWRWLLVILVWQFLNLNSPPPHEEFKINRHVILNNFVINSISEEYIIKGFHLMTLNKCRPLKVLKLHPLRRNHLQLDHLFESRFAAECPTNKILNYM